MLSKLISTNNKYYYRIILAIFFILIGLVISITSVFVTGYYQLKAVNKEFNISAKRTFKQKENLLYTRTNNFKNYLKAVDSTTEFKDFIHNTSDNALQTKQHITNLIIAISKSVPTIMQFRFINQDGLETIRVDRSSIDTTPFLVAKEALQNKAERYYFKEVKEFPKNKIWFSNLDLNVEHGEIVKPIVPTLRIAKPYYVNDTFKGMLIINIFMKDLLHELMSSELFNVTLIDKNEYILTSNQNDKQKWTQYLEHTKNTDDENIPFLSMLYKSKKSILDLSPILHNKEALKIIITEKPERLAEYTNDLLNYMLVMGIIIFVLSFPMVVLFARHPAKLHEKLEVLKNKLTDKLKILDNYVYSSRTDINGNITDVSQAFCELSGYTRSELIGQKHSILRNTDTNPSLFTIMWSNILDGKKWTGAIKNTAKDGSPYWVKTHITPELEGNNIVAFTAISQNITDQKRMEEISIKDELTQIYNRRYFNQIFPSELKRAKRNSTVLCIAMFDIDHFKKYNDTYGHIQGDETLQNVAKTISKKLQRPGDYLFRIGGEEFMIIYADVQSYTDAQKFSLEIVKSIEELQIEHTSSDTSNVVTISLGHLTITPACTMAEQTILQEVDNILYSAKDAGRNQSRHREC